MNFRILILAGAMLLPVCAAMVVTPAHAGLFGESDEEKAARIREQNQDATIQDLSQRVRDLEETLRQRTGQYEALSHQIQQLNDKVERQKKDFEYRLCQLSAQQLGAGESDDTPLPCGGAARATFAPPPSDAPAQSGGPHLAPPPGVLGTLPAGQANGLRPPPASGGADTRAQFNAALDLAAKARYDDSRAAFRNFADANPDDELAPQAIYWVGDIAFLQKDYAGAARAFAEEIKKYPASSRSPESMLKLGQSLIALGQNKEGCMTLGALPSKYPNASKTVVARAASERGASCH
ncbi:MAG TPA: tol-pal system protein YbgF [Rhizomicrobium sp.]|jgi:tol-pal system protein YbgF|nr:tol-pal system protein YbgF [Rhizomicrobium sp.]